MRRVLLVVTVAIAVAAGSACEEVTDPLPRDAGAMEASTEIPEAGMPCSIVQPCLPGTTDAALGEGGL